MADKRGKEEYQLPEEENLESHYEEDEVQFSEKPQRTPFSAKDVLLSKKVLIPAFVIFGVYGLYKFMEFRDKQQMKAQQPAATTQQQPEAQQQVPVQAPPSDNLAARNDLQATVEQTNKNQAQLDSVGTQLNQLQLTQTQMNSELTELSDAMKAFTTKLEQPRLDVIPCQPKVVKKVKRYYQRVVVRGPSYHIRAVVPGRAWLVSSSGRLFTVRVGDRISGLGVVEDIDVLRGVVIMSSGREITYGKYDS